MHGNDRHCCASNFAGGTRRRWPRLARVSRESWAENTTAAVRLAPQGKPFPSHIEAWTRLYLDCNWALACGPDSGVYVLDIDGPEGKASIDAWERRGWNLPVTRTHKTTRGKHLLFNWPEGFAVTISAGKLGAGLDERGKNGYILLPPSLHPSGHRYACEDEAAPLADMPQWLIDLHRGPVQAAPATPQPVTSIERGKRTPLLFKLAGKLRAECVPPEDLAALKGLNATFDSPHDEAKVRKIARILNVTRLVACQPSRRCLSFRLQRLCRWKMRPESRKSYSKRAERGFGATPLYRTSKPSL